MSEDIGSIRSILDNAFVCAAKEKAEQIAGGQMSAGKTPETDAILRRQARSYLDAGTGYKELMEHARKLEQQRDMLAGACDGLLSCIMETRGPNAYAAVEKAREALRSIGRENV